MKSEHGAALWMLAKNSCLRMQLRMLKFLEEEYYGKEITVFDDLCFIVWSG
jgi:hypothetical protein